MVLLYIHVLLSSLLFCINSQLLPGKNLYSEYQVLRTYPMTDEHLQHLSELEADVLLDFWTKPHYINDTVDIMTSKNTSMMALMNDLDRHGIESEIWISNVRELILNSTSQSLQARIKNIEDDNDDFSWNTYHTFNEINEWMKDLEEEHPMKISVHHIGFSYELRPMKVLKLSLKPHDKKPAVWIDGGAHGREWISPAVVTYIINELLKNETYSQLTSKVDFYFLPVTNPDGYAYTFTEDGRLWSKTRSRNPSFMNCRGVNMDTNWDYHWQETYSSACNQDFPGESAFSEVETIHIRSQLLSIRKDLRAYLTFHSYSQQWLYPWGYTTEWTNNYQDIANLASAATAALFSYRETRYVPHSMCTNEQSCTFGSSIDWVKGVALNKYTYHIKLPDIGKYGFLLPPSEIVPTGEEIIMAVNVIAQQVIDEFYYS